MGKSALVWRTRVCMLFFYFRYAGETRSGQQMKTSDNDKLRAFELGTTANNMSGNTRMRGLRYMLSYLEADKIVEWRRGWESALTKYFTRGIQGALFICIRTTAAP